MQICYKDTTKYRIWLFIRLFFTLIFSILPESGALGGVVVFSHGESIRGFFEAKTPQISSKKGIFAETNKQMNGARILIIYTGGTIGMLENPTTGALEAFDWEHISNFVPELARFHYDIETITFGPPIDSSDMEPKYWTRMVEVIADNYDNYEGFVLLHGTDTMAFTASALSFMLENLSKPVIITGSQLPIGQLRTDGKENLLTSIAIAAARDPDGSPVVPEVCIFFENKLLRGNRTTKINSEGFNAFRSYNFHNLADAGIHIKFEEAFIHRPDPEKPFRPNYLLDDHVAILTLFPGMREEVMNAYLTIPNLRGLVLKTYGAGNAPKLPWLYERLKELSNRGVVIVNTTQCSTGAVDMGRYDTSLQLIEAGVLNGHDMTLECVVTKLMFLLGHNYERSRICELMNTSLAGEVTLPCGDSSTESGCFLRSHLAPVHRLCAD